MTKDLSFAKDKSVLIIIDMQNAFIDPKGSLSRMGLDTSRARRVIGPISELRRAFRERGRPIFYLRHLHRRDGLDAGLIGKVFPPITELGHCREGTWDAEIIEGLEPGPQEIVVDKYRFSGFFNTQLDTLLRAAGAESLAVCGIATNICVESTVRDAFYRDYNVFVPLETTAGFSEEPEKAALENFRFAFARVVTLDQMLGGLG